jgi:hypothetical protein
LEKVKDGGENLTMVLAMPVPVRLTVWTVGLALSVMVRAPVLVPVAVGRKLTAMLHEAPAATLAPQLLVSEKSALGLMLLMLSSAVPIFVSDTVWGLLLVITL